MILDRAAAARTLSDEEFRAWAEDRRVFISSVMGELRAERAAVAQAVDGVGLRPVWFERFGGRDDDPEAAYLGEVDSADIYLGFLADEYGRMDPVTGFSATHAEYLRARERGRRVSFWSKEPAANRQGHARSFLEEVRTFQVTGTFTTPDDLARQVLERLKSMAADDVSPWVKVGDAVFRADVIRDDGGMIGIEARIRDADVAAYLEGLRSDGLGHNRVRVTVGDRSLEAEVRTVRTETRSAMIRKFLLEFGAAASRAGSSMRFGMQGLSANESVEARLRHALLDEPLPPPLQDRFTQAALGEMSDPLAALAALNVAEGAVEPLGRLLLVEALVGTGTIGRIRRFALGPEVAGRRRLALEWEDLREYANVEPAVRRLDGDRPWSRFRRALLAAEGRDTDRPFVR